MPGARFSARTRKSTIPDVRHGKQAGGVLDSGGSCGQPLTTRLSLKSDP
jgi:hypothetical protein